jgi:hypothetical protein
MTTINFKDGTYTIDFQDLNVRNFFSFNGKLFFKTTCNEALCLDDGGLVTFSKTAQIRYVKQIDALI